MHKLLIILAGGGLKGVPSEASIISCFDLNLGAYIDITY